MDGSIPHAERVASIIDAGRRVTSTIDAGSDNRPDSDIVQSWSRCVRQYGIDPSQPHSTVVVEAGDLRQRQQQLGEILRVAHGEMTNLYRQIAGSGYAILFTDSDGIIVDNVSDPAQSKALNRSGLWLGAHWNERHEGTNGIGTCLVEKRPVTIHQDEHFRAGNIGLTCSGAPVFDPHGELLAVLDASAVNPRDSKQSQFHTAALVTLSAKLLESFAFLARFRDRWVLRFHQRPEFVGMISEGMVALDGDGRVLALNQSALNQLHGDGREPFIGRPITELLDLPIDQLFARAGPAPSAVWPVRDHGGRRYHALLVGRAAQTSSSGGLPQAPSALPLSLDQLAGGDPQMAENVRRAKRLLDQDVSILLSGETGTGKEVFARAIHQASRRAGCCFMAVNCAAIPENLIESELFGYREGAFTGARRGGQRGKLLQADGGTLLLDEIGDMPLGLQTRLLRVLEEQTVLPLGADKPVPVKLTVISASHRDLAERVAAGQFREDLYYRLNGITLELPPLRQRQDRAALIDALLRAAHPTGRAPTVDPDAMTALLGYRWPGNLRQLRNVLRTAAALCDDGRIRPHDLPRDVIAETTPSDATPAGPVAGGGAVLAEAEKTALLEALRHSDWNVTATAARLATSRNTLYRKMARHGIRPARHRSEQAG